MRPLVPILALVLSACSSAPRVRLEGEVHRVDATKSSAKPGIYELSAATPDAPTLPLVDGPKVLMSPRTRYVFRDHASSMGATVDGSRFTLNLELTNGGKRVYDRFVDFILKVEAPGYRSIERTFEVPADELHFDRELLVVLEPEEK
jgi:hypothetical protein